MSYGIQVINNSGFIQIDENFANFVEWASGTAAVGNTVSFPLTSSPPLILARPHECGKWIGLFGDDYDSFSTKGNPMNFDYKIMVPSSDVGPAAGTTGLRVFNSAGKVTFDSGTSNIFRIGIALNVNHGLQDPHITVNVPASSNGVPYAALNSTRLRAVIPQAGGAPVIMLLLRQMSATSYEIGHVEVDRIAEDASFDMPIPSTFFFGTVI